MAKPIENKQDVEFLVRDFYGKVLMDEQIKHHFAHIDFEAHMPRMVAFWSFILLDEDGYKGNVFDKHVPLNLNENDFLRWMLHFKETIKNNFVGEKADLALQRAEILSLTFQAKLIKK